VATTYLFPGQGSQYVGMGRKAYEESADARLYFEEADDLLGFRLSDLIFNGPDEKLTETQYQQPALFVSSMANWQRMLEEDWPAANYAAGHSLGEFTALAAAGAMSFSDGLKLVCKRGELMKQAGKISPGAMAAILALPVEEIETLCIQAQEETRKIVQVANDNCPGQTVISGDVAALQRAMELAGEAGARRVVQLPISIAAHSPLMESVAGEFSEAVDAAPLNTSQIPVIANVSAQPLQSIEDIRRELKAQLTSPVAWTPSMHWLLAAGSDTFVEAGPKDVLLGLLKRIDRQAERLAFDKEGEK